MIVEFKLASTNLHLAVSHVKLNTQFIEGIRQMGDTHSTEIIMVSGTVWTVDALYADVAMAIWSDAYTRVVTPRMAEQK